MPDEPEEPRSAVERLSSGLVTVFEGGAEGRRQYYLDHPTERPNAGDIDRIIAYYANLNAVVSGGLSLIHGPWGMLVAIPEVVVVIRNQAKMSTTSGWRWGRTTS